MREMYKWKDKVELSLDNRQIFFLFFGVSVVGCFVFALGLMVGRRIPWDPRGEALAAPEPSLAVLGEEDDEPTLPPLTFEHAFDAPAKTPEAPAEPVEDPGVLADASAIPPATEPALPTSSKPAPGIASTKPAIPPATSPTKPVSPRPSASPKPAPVAAPKKAAAGSATLAARQADPPASATGPRKFTLQMKAFSKADEANVFAAKLREHGHAVRVEAHPVNGRVWHRVRVGEFTTWTDGLAAKEAFERREGIIAYVVRE